MEDATEDMLSKYEVIVLGREVQAFLSDDVVQRLKRWLVAGDGALVCYRGAPVAQINEGLAQLLPVRWSPAREQRFRVQLTEPGKSLRWLPAQHDQDPLSGLPSLATVTQSDSKQPLAVVLANSQVVSDTPAPVISYQRVGNGRVMVIEGAGMWRWAMLSPEHQSRDQVYGSLWRSLIRWLVTSRGLLPSESIALRSDKVIFATNEPAGLTVLTRTPLRGSTTVTLSGEALGKPQAFAPISVPGIDGQARVVFGKLPEGRYDVSVTEGPAAHLGVGITFEVRDRLTERIDVAARGDLMRLLAESSGGEVLQSADAGQLAKALNIHLADAFPSRFRRRIAWDRWWVLAILCTTWATTWAIRRRSGLI